MPEYVCSNCGKETPRNLLTVKRTQFLGMGAGAKIQRSRVEGWYCPECTVKDEDWKMTKFSSRRRKTVDAQ